MVSAISSISSQSCEAQVNSAMADYGKLVYVADAKEGYVLGRLADLGADTLSVDLLPPGQGSVSVPHDSVLPAEEDQTKDVDDNCALMYLNEATLLHNCRLRYSRKQIYTYVANILISINPYENVPDLYSIDTIRRYQGKSLGTLPPHVFAIADKAYRDMKRVRESQSVIVSGESGAGKTESQKCILRYLCECWGSSAGPVEQRLLETNPILEAFGNAKTMRNNNSSRFGKFVEIHFGQKYQVAGGFVSHYLLEKSRLCHQHAGERNYHVFYQLLAGADAQTAQRLRLAPADKFNYLRNGTTQFFASASSASHIPADRKAKKDNITDSMVDDYADFQRLCRALKEIGLDDSLLDGLFRTIAAILHLGNVEFIENANDSRGGCTVKPSTMPSLETAAELLGLNELELRHGLISRLMQPTKSGVKGTMIMVPLKIHEANAARDALSKAIYSRLFDNVVASINQCIPFSDSVNYIGVLDIAGFEFFAVNSFEQFCINYCNEKLQQFFNDRILKQEQELYEKEGLNVERIEYSDNKDCIDLFEERTNGLLDMLDEEARLPRPAPQHFTAGVHQRHQKHFRLTEPRRSRIKEHREMRDDEGFIIRHYAGAVCYQTALFLEKNNDALHASLEFLMEQSENVYTKKLFGHQENGNGVPAINGKSQHQKLSVASVSSKFRSQLGLLLHKLENTGTHFVRCIKPNSDMAPGQFEGAQILSQLKCAGMTSVLKLMQKGYPSRTHFADLYATYKAMLPPELARLDPRLFCKCLFHALGLNDRDFKFGMTKVFFRPGKFAEFDQLMRQDQESMASLINKVKSWLHCVRWKKAQYGVLSCIKLQNKIKYRAEHLVKIQSAVRGFIARRRHRPRVAAYRKVRSLSSRGTELGQIASRLEPTSRSTWSPKMEALNGEIVSLLRDIKNDLMKNYAEASKRSETLENAFEELLSQLKKQIDEDEKERVRRMEAEARAQREREEAERRDREEQERQRIERRELELKRQKEEEERQARAKQLEEQRRLEEQEKSERARKQEQERLDDELARRLVSENSAVQIAEPSAQNTASLAVSTGRYDLSSWKYVDLRDAINTSNDIDLLNACREEFHRRLRVYQDWKAKNAKSQPDTSSVERQRAPDFIMANANTAPSDKTAASAQAQSIQRYFRVPFTTKGGTAGAPGSTGYWYAHFDGQYVARQMEQHPNKPTLLLVAGRDDEKMCELALEQTQLTRRKGAEILAHEFESLWTRFGGPAYNPLSRRGKQQAHANGTGTN
ncbi:myosin protein [Aphelenchoides avenae]|nr:myosin protein [Aphelenchus avenae]